MFEALTAFAATSAAGAQSIANPTPRAASAVQQIEPWFAMLLDELDYGVVLLRDSAQVVHLNHAARIELRAGRGVELVGGSLVARRAADARVLGDALAAASQRGLRRLVTVGDEGERVAVALIPIGAPATKEPGLTLAVFGRRRLCERISVQWFARAHGLTQAESTVLDHLSEGLDPREIADANEVGMATVRTQVNSIRAKTGTASIRDLLQQLAMLPPIVNTLRM
jgi:DNA-binding CsgD family transcriptional regulator